MNGNDKTDASLTTIIPTRPREQADARYRKDCGPLCDEPTLRLRAREAIQCGKLPARQATRASSGPGLGTNCKVCGWPVAHFELGFEIELSPDPEIASSPERYELHVRCYAAWELERRNFRVVEGVLPTESDHGTIANRDHDTTNARGPV